MWLGYTFLFFSWEFSKLRHDYTGMEFSTNVDLSKPIGL